MTTLPEASQAPSSPIVRGSLDLSEIDDQGLFTPSFRSFRHFTMVGQAMFSSFSAPESNGSLPSSSSSCSWPITIVSQSRELDLTSCFEHAVLLPVPLILGIIFASMQIFSKSRRLKRRVSEAGLRWHERTSGSERVCRIKIVRFAYLCAMWTSRANMRS